MFCKTDLNAVVPKIIKKWSREADDSAIDEVDGMDTANSTSELSEEQIDEYLSDYTESSESEKDRSCRCLSVRSSFSILSNVTIISVNIKISCQLTVFHSYLEYIKCITCTAIDVSSL